MSLEEQQPMLSLGEFLYKKEQRHERSPSGMMTMMGDGSVSSISSSGSSSNSNRRRSSRRRSSYIRRGNCLGTTTTTKSGSPLGGAGAWQADDDDEDDQEDFLLLPHQFSGKVNVMKDGSNQSNETEETCSIVSDLEEDDFSFHSDGMDSSSFIDGGHCRFHPGESVSILDIVEDDLREMDLANSEPDLLPPPGTTSMQRINQERRSQRRGLKNDEDTEESDDEDQLLAKFLQDRLTLFHKNVNFLQCELNASIASLMDGSSKHNGK